MIKKVVLTNIFSVMILLTSLYLVSIEGFDELLGGCLILLFSCIYIALNSVMIALTVANKENCDSNDFTFATVSYIFNLVYPVLGIVIALT